MATNTITKYAYTDETFVQVRENLHKQGRLGGSEVGTAEGCNKFRSTRRMYEEWVGTLPAEDVSGKIAVRDGHILEPIAAGLFEKRSGKKVHRVNAVMTSDAARHLFASLDRKIENEDSGLEIKTCSAWNSDAFADEKLPASYVRQVKTYMKVTGFPRWYVFVWSANTFEKCYLYTLDAAEAANKPEWVDVAIVVTPAELDACEEIAAAFIHAVETKTPPPCDGTDDETDVLKELFPESAEGKTVTLTSVSEADLTLLAEKKANIKAEEEAIATIENRIKAEMGNAAEGLIGARRVTWKNNKPSEKVDYKRLVSDIGFDETTLKRYTEIKPGARVLRITKAK